MCVIERGGSVRDGFGRGSCLSLCVDLMCSRGLACKFKASQVGGRGGGAKKAGARLPPYQTRELSRVCVLDKTSVRNHEHTKRTACKKSGEDPLPNSLTRPPPHPALTPSPLVRRKVEELNAGGNPDEKEMDRYLKAHDDLQTVLRVYDAVLDGNEPLPLSRGAAAGAAVRGTGEATTAAEAAFAATANGNASSGGGYSSDDESTEGGVGRRGARAAKAAGASGGKSSPAKGNLLDLEENAPLETDMTGEGAGGMMVAYAGGGQFMASNTNSVGGVSGVGGVGFDSTSSGPQGSATASNYASASDTGAVYGSNQFGSNLGSNNVGSSQFSSGGGVGEGPSAFGELCDGLLHGGLVASLCCCAMPTTAWDVCMIHTNRSHCFVV